MFKLLKKYKMGLKSPIRSSLQCEHHSHNIKKINEGI